jgi:hypothetical protein
VEGGSNQVAKCFGHVILRYTIPVLESSVVTIHRKYAEASRRGNALIT